MMAAQSISPERRVLGVFTALVVACLLASFFAAWHLPLPASFALAIALAGAATPWLWRRLPASLDGASGARGLGFYLWVFVGLIAVARTAGLALFMADPELAQASAYWFDEFYIRHNCFSALWQAAVVALDGKPNIYNPEHYVDFVGRFKLDEFLYPPQTLLVPLTGMAIGADFFSLRAAWFALEGAIVLGAMFAIAFHVGGVTGRRVAMLVPAVWLASPTMLTLQVGNFQLAVIAMSLVAMILFERGRPMLGGALFGFAVFKIFPGLLGIYLLVTRQWRAAAWTAAFAAVYSLFALAWLGRAPFEDFLHFQLPRMASGEAWAFLEFEGLESVVAINDSIPGLVLKLKVLGVPGMTRALEASVSWGWSLVAVGFAIFAGLRHARASRLERVSIWLALLALAAARSPFLPDHNGLFAPIWLWALVAARYTPTPRAVVAMIASWFVLSTVLPFTGAPLTEGMGRLAVSTFSQFASLGLCLWVLLRRPGAVPDDEAVAQAPSARAVELQRAA